MAGAFDTLEILIEADSSGLESQLKRAGETVVSFVDKMNNQQVNWEQILAGTITPAIITGIAATFALAITQALSFQNTMMDVSNNAAGSLQDGTGQMGASVASLAGQTGASLSDTASAFEMLAKQFGSTAAAQQLTAQIGELALASNQSLSDLMPQLINLFNQWGITTLPQAEDALTGLTNEAGKGKFSLDELIDTISSQGPILQGKTNITDLAAGMQALSEQTDLSKTSIINGMTSIANAIAQPGSSMIALTNNFGKTLNGPDGLVKAFQDVATEVNQFGPIAGPQLASQFGLTNNSIVQFQTVSKKAFKDAQDQADQTVAHMQPLNDILKANLSDMDKLAQDFGELKALLATDFGGPFLKFLDTVIVDINSLLGENGIKGFVGAIGDIGSFFAKIMPFLPGADIANAANTVGNTSIGQTGLSSLESFFSNFLKGPAVSTNAPPTNVANSNNTANSAVTNNFNIASGPNTGGTVKNLLQMNNSLFYGVTPSF